MTPPSDCPKCGKKIHHITVLADEQGVLVVQIHHSAGMAKGTTHCTLAPRGGEPLRSASPDPAPA